MASPLVLIHRILGLAAAPRRARPAARRSTMASASAMSRPSGRGIGQNARDRLERAVQQAAHTVPAGQLPVDSLTRAGSTRPRSRSLYRLGHSTLLLKLRGEFWTDPVFAERASPFRARRPKRFHAPPIALEDLPPLRDPVARSLRSSRPRHGARARGHHRRVRDDAGSATA